MNICTIRTVHGDLLKDKQFHNYHICTVHVNSLHDVFLIYDTIFIYPPVVYIYKYIIIKCTIKCKAADAYCALPEKNNLSNEYI